MLKSFSATVYALIALFLLVMGTVALVAFMRSSNSTGLDPSQIKKIREISKRQ